MNDALDHGEAMRRPPFQTWKFEYDGNAMRAVLPIDDIVRDISRRVSEIEQVAYRDALKSLGWVPPDELAAHEREVAAKALREVAPSLHCGYDSEWCTSRADELEGEG